MALMMPVMNSPQSSAPKMMSNGTMPGMNYQPQAVFAPSGSGYGTAPGNWQDNMLAGDMSSVSASGQQLPQQQSHSSVGSAYPVIVYPVMQSLDNGMQQLPEQAVLSGCGASDSASCQGYRQVSFFSMETLPTMAAQSMDSLPTMSGFSLESLPSMAVMSMDSLPEMPVSPVSKIGPAQSCIGTSRAYAVSSVESLPDFPAQKQGTRRKKRGGRNIELGLESAQRKGVEEVNDLAGRQPQAPAAAKVEATMKEEPAVEPDVDPVILELEGSNQSTKRSTLDWVIKSVWPLALTRRGSRILQKALDVGTPTDQLQILYRLEGHVQEAMRSPHANYVLQKCIEVMAPERVQFILDELKGHAVLAARHRFGCRILQRLVEHCPLEQTEELSLEVLSDVGALCRHQFGNFVVQHILQHGSSSHKHCIADVLHGDVIRLAKHRIASHVVSCALVHCAPEDVQRLTQVVLADAGQLADLSRREYGSFVVREVNRARRLQG